MRENWQSMLKFIQMVVSQFDISQTHTRVGLISFGNLATVEINLDDHDDMASLLIDIGKVNWKDQWTNTPDALREARAEFLRSPRSVQKVALLITDGEANVSPEKLQFNAEDLTGEGVDVLVMAVGLDANFPEAEVIAGTTLNVIPVVSFDSLLDNMIGFVELVTSRICGTGELSFHVPCSLCFYKA